MNEPVLQTELQLADYRARNSTAGLLVRYAKGRVTNFVSRQWVTLYGGLVLVLLGGWRIGLLAISVVLFGEAVDCLYLRYIANQQAKQLRYRSAYIISSITAGFQSLTIAACAILAGVVAPEGHSTLIVLAYLTGAAVNAGVVYPFHPIAAIVRLCVFAGTVVAHFAIDVVTAGGWEPHHSYDLSAAGMFLFLVYHFIGYVVRVRANETSNRLALLSGQLAEERISHDLLNKQREASQLSLVARHANDSVILSDAYSNILWVNDAFTQITGYSAEEAIGRSPADLLNGPDTSLETCERIMEARRAGLPCREEVLNVRRDGKPIWVEANIVPIIGADGKVETIVAIERDITEAKEHERLLAEAKLAAEEGARAKAEFLATMSHEIRTPMNGIIGMAELLADTALTKDQSLYAETIRNSAASLLTIVNDVLDFSRLDANRMSICSEKFSLAACIRESADLLLVQAREKGLFLDICHDVPLPEIVLGDRGRMRQILVNLLGNALKFTTKGGITLRTRWENSDSRIKLTVTVTDTGIGIDPAISEHIFDQFAQADAATTRRFGGTGLGLSISRLLARRMGGDLYLTAHSGPGAQFEATLIFDVADEAGEAAPAADITTLRSGLRLVIAEDNITNRLLLEKYLSDEPIDLRFAEDGVQAVNLAREAMPDVILMDMSMPEMDGLAATRLIRKIDGPQPHIIALTANAFDSDREACFEAGMNDFLSKPVRKAQLFQALSRATENE